MCDTSNKTKKKEDGKKSGVLKDRNWQSPGRSGVPAARLLRMFVVPLGSRRRRESGR